ncbi:glucose transporter type 1 isoform X3 [Venturia canescens]|uniref:glucose transporter type 1 isoform X3 n=1 Tax=Venturia canescens TaxID=32260 RepID=UPI001C9BDEB2|nr:glucose transporter type 1 isoform X3 [Venturia canescens]
MSDSRGFKPISQLWNAAVSGDPDSECLYEEISGISSSREIGPVVDSRSLADSRTIIPVGEGTIDRARKKRKVGRVHHQGGVEEEETNEEDEEEEEDEDEEEEEEEAAEGIGRVGGRSSGGGEGGGGGGGGSGGGEKGDGRRSRSGEEENGIRTRVEELRYVSRGYYGEVNTGGQIEAAATYKLTRGRSAAARYLQSAAAAAAHYHHQHQQQQQQQYYQQQSYHQQPYHHHHHHHPHHQIGSLRRTGKQRHYQFPRGGPFSDETQEEIQEDDEATLRELLVSLQKQVSVMSMNLSAKLDELQRGDRQLETTVALCEIRTQLQELTKSVESCQSEVSEVKRDMVAIKQELDTVQQVKDEIESLREYVDRLEEHSHRRKLRLLEQGLTFFLSYAILAAVLGMLQFGYNTGVINAPQGNIENFMKDVYKDRYGEDLSDKAVQKLYSVAVSIFAIGGMVGGFSGGIIANRFGRKGGLLLNNVLGIVGACLMGCTKIAQSYEMLFFGRFVIGVNCGLNTSLVPMYISEIAPLNLRGGLGTVNQLAVTVGLLVSQVLGIEQILGTNDGWPVLLGLAICPAILQLVLLPICPESPRYLLITKQWEEEARKALRRLRASNQVEEDIEEMRAEERAQLAESTISMTELICSPTLRAPLVIGVVMQLSQQLSGINAVFYYSTNLFKSAGLSEESAKFATIGIGAIMVCMTLISIPLMDRTGRRTLHLYGLGGMFIFSIFITISFLIKEMIDWMSYLSVVSTLSFVVFFAVGPGSIPWMITAELFSQGPRPAAMSIAVLVNWMANFIVGIAFPSMMDCLDNYTFLPFSACLAFFWIFTYKKVPETKNKTFEEILALFRHGHDRSSLRDSRLYGSMLNSVNALEGHNPPAESAALMVAEEKPRPDSFVFAAGSERSSIAPAQPERAPPPLPPPRFPNSGV